MGTPPEGIASQNPQSLDRRGKAPPRKRLLCTVTSVTIVTSRGLISSLSLVLIVMGSSGDRGDTGDELVGDFLDRDQSLTRSGFALTKDDLYLDCAQRGSEPLQMIPDRLRSLRHRPGSLLDLT